MQNSKDVVSLINVFHTYFCRMSLHITYIMLVCRVREVSMLHCSNFIALQSRASIPVLSSLIMASVFSALNAMICSTSKTFFWVKMFVECLRQIFKNQCCSRPMFLYELRYISILNYCLMVIISYLKLILAHLRLDVSLISLIIVIRLS